MEVSCNTNTSARRCLDLLFQGTFFLFLLTPNRQVRINKMVNSISLKETSFHVSKYKLLRALSLSRMLAEFSLKLLYSTKCGKNFQIDGVHIPGKCTDSRHFHSWSSPLKTCPQVFVITSKAEGNYSFPQATLFRKSVFPKSRKEWKKL